MKLLLLLTAIYGAGAQCEVPKAELAPAALVKPADCLKAKAASYALIGLALPGLLIFPI